MPSSWIPTSVQAALAPTVCVSYFLRISPLSFRSATVEASMTAMSELSGVSRRTVASMPLSVFKPASSGSRVAAFLVPRRGLAGGTDHLGPPKVNFWEDPMNPSKWKEEHFVIVSLAGWGLLFYGGYKFFTGGKDNNKKEEKAGEASR